MLFNHFIEMSSEAAPVTFHDYFVEQVEHGHPVLRLVVLPDLGDDCLERGLEDRGVLEDQVGLLLQERVRFLLTDHSVDVFHQNGHEGPHIVGIVELVMHAILLISRPSNNKAAI